MKLRASIRTLSGSPVRPHGDWDSRKLTIYGEVLLGESRSRVPVFVEDDRVDGDQLDP